MSKDSDKKILRREMLRGSAKVGLALIAAPVLAACSKSPTVLRCDDTVGMKPDDVANRKTLEYVDKSPDATKTCTLCQQFVAPPAANSCGTCKVLKGSVNPAGYCKSFVAKTTTPT